jgi:Glycosyl transferase family 2
MMLAKRIVKQLLPSKWRRKFRECIISMNVKHVHGPRKIRLGANEAVVTCIVRNGEFYMERFIRHHFRLGFRHLVFLDNGSTDRTIEIAKQHNNVSIFTSTLPIEMYQPLLKKRLPLIAARGGWCFDADIDEFFEYPLSDTVSLARFLEYLNTNRYQAVITQMLDMFGGRPISSSAQAEQEDLEDELNHLYPFYDLSDVAKTDYRTSELTMKFASGNSLSNDAPRLCWGGIRKTLAGNEVLLTKHSLFSLEKGPELFPHVHFINHARLADVSCVLLHYKLTSSAMAIALQNMEHFPGNEKVYRDFIEFLTRKPEFEVKRPTAKKLRTTYQLVEDEFLFVSDVYMKYAEQLPRNKVPACAS